MDEPLHQPHDKLFTTTFGVPENAAAFIQATLPETLTSRLDWSGLLPMPGSFVDSRYRRSHSDLLFSVPLEGREVLLYILFEHQSTRDPWLSLRLLRYMVNIWDDSQRRHPDAEKLPPILPVVLSQNAESWASAPSILELLDIPEDFPDEFVEILRRYVPDFSHIHLQLAGMDYEEIPGTPAGIYVLRAMKAERLGKLLDEAVWDEALMSATPRDLVMMVLRYIQGRTVDIESFEAKVEGIRNTRLRRDAMTVAEQYRQQGLQEGLQEGLQ
ncbi:MAG: Rpn family recombination-promoting nuclease/putative transposase, partial [Verrucomicrobiaceae bacterium]|nr:Rpn family recombination-promoting nuclease/putative transposase [Verrucomicrobiaceae bacterium]